MSDASICGLGQAAMNPVKLVLKHFREDLKRDAHPAPRHSRESGDPGRQCTSHGIPGAPLARG